MADVCNRSDCIIRNPRLEMKGMQEKEVIMGVPGREKNPSLGITVWHHSASLVMPNSDPRNGIFHLPLTPMIDPYILACRIRLSANYTGASKSCLTHVGKIKVCLIYTRLYRTSWYAIVRVDGTERNDVSKRQGIVITIWRTSAIEVTAILKIRIQK